jgi:hypothetical protein
MLEKHLMNGGQLAANKTRWIACVMLLVAGVARAQDLPDNIRTAGNPAPFLNQIESFVRDLSGKVGGADPSAQSKAREALTKQIAPLAAGGVLSAQFLETYAGVVNSELLKLSQSKDARVRLNAAIIAAKVAEGAKNARLQPAVMALLKDPSDAVVWWALRGAKHVLPYSLAGSDGAALVAAIVQIGQSRSGVMQGVYDALAIEGLPSTQTTRVLQVTVPALQTILKSRIDQYKTGFPADTTAESRAATYLTAKAQWDVLSLTQKVDTAQRLSDLLGVAEKRAPDLTNEQRADLVAMLKGVGGAVVVIGQWEGNTNLQTAARPVNQLAKNSTAKDIQNAVKPVYTAMLGVEKFKKLTPPPSIGEMVADPGSPALPGPSTTSTAASGSR